MVITPPTESLFALSDDRRGGRQAAAKYNYS